jgi:hypothetical protein
MAANWCILHSHGNYGSKGRKSYILIRSGYKNKESARAAAKSWRYGDVVDDHRIVKRSQVKPVVSKGKVVKSLYEVRGLFSR